MSRFCFERILRSALPVALLSAGLSADSTQPTERDIHYGTFPQTVLDIWEPAASPSHKRPGVLIIHGGGWTSSDKEHLVPFCSEWVRHGFVVVNVEYRLARVASAPAAVNDVLEAARWFRKNAPRYHVDPRRIVVAGGSAGGHLALMVAFTPKSAGLGPVTKMAAVVNLFGIADVAYQLGSRPANGSWLPEGPQRLGLARHVSPLNYVRRGLPPVLTIHGDADPTVSYDQAVALTAALRRAGDRAELYTIKAGHHGFPSAQMHSEIYPRIFLFLKELGISEE